MGSRKRMVELLANAAGWIALGAAPFQETAQAFWVCVGASFAALVIEEWAGRARTRGLLTACAERAR